jgi:DNA-binding Xre family transcriptional regulator
VQRRIVFETYPEEGRMTSQVAVDKLAALIKAKRGRKGLRETAVEIGEISASTLSRIEKGKMPDLDTFLRLCDWLDIQPNELINGIAKRDPTSGEKAIPMPDDMSTPEIVEAHLRADKELDPETAEALANMVRSAYRAVVEGQLGSKKRVGRKRS